MISNLLIDEVVGFIDNLARKAVVTIDGGEIELDILKTVISGNNIRKYVLVSSSDRGFISSAELVDSSGRTLQTSNVSVSKDKSGFMVVFSINVEIGDD